MAGINITAVEEAEAAAPIRARKIVRVQPAGERGQVQPKEG